MTQLPKPSSPLQVPSPDLLGKAGARLWAAFCDPRCPRLQRAPYQVIRNTAVPGTAIFLRLDAWTEGRDELGNGWMRYRIWLPDGASWEWNEASALEASFLASLGVPVLEKEQVDFDSHGEMITVEFRVQELPPLLLACSRDQQDHHFRFPDGSPPLAERPLSAHEKLTLIPVMEQLQALVDETEHMTPGLPIRFIGRDMLS